LYKEYKKEKISINIKYGFFGRGFNKNQNATTPNTILKIK